MKKYLLIALVVTSLIGSVAANGSSESNGYNAPIATEKFEFSATLNGKSVSMKWNQFDSFSSESLRYYKVVRSSSNPKPVYPDDGYIKYGADMSFTSYIDNEPKTGINYYRVCAITEKQNRYCSNVVKIEIASDKIGMANPASVNCIKQGGKLTISDETGGQVGYCKLPSGQICEEWQLYRGECKISKEEKKEIIKPVVNKESLLSKRATNVVAQFEKKLNEKYGNDAEKRTAVINTTIASLEALKAKRTTMKDYINILIEKLKDLIDDTSEIDSILSI